MTRLGGRDEHDHFARGHTSSPDYLIKRQEAHVPSAEPDSLPREEGSASPTVLPSYPCGTGNMHGVFCPKPRGHSGRHGF